MLMIKGTQSGCGMVCGIEHSDLRFESIRSDSLGKLIRFPKKLEHPI